MYPTDWINFGLTHEELSRVPQAMAFQSCYCSFFYRKAGVWGVLLCLLHGECLIMSASG